MTKRGRLNTLLKKIIVGILLVLVILGTTFTASAESETYIKVDVPGNLQEQRLSKDMYYPVAEINAATLGLKENFKGITDLFYNDASKILLFRKYFSLFIYHTKSGGKPPLKMLFCAENSVACIAETGNNIAMVIKMVIKSTDKNINIGMSVTNCF